jgi:hypothetical protein
VNGNGALGLHSAIRVLTTNINTINKRYSIMSKIAMIRFIADKLIEAETQEQKQEVLQRYSDDTLFKRILYYTYNPMIVFGMDEYHPQKTKFGIDGGMGISKFMHVADDLYQNKLDYQEATFACNLVLTHINEQEAELFLGMIKKDIGVNIDIATINNVWPDFIPTYPVQYATEYTSELEKSITFPAVCQPRYKGTRINIIVRMNTVEFRDEQGKILTGFEEYGADFSHLAQNQATVFDGCFKNTSKGKRFVIWDVIRYDGFVKGSDNRLGYNWRFNGLEHMWLIAQEKTPKPCYKIAICNSVTSWSNARKAAKDIKSDIIVKNLDGTWQNGFVNDQLVLRVKKKTVSTKLSTNNTTVSTDATT